MRKMQAAGVNYSFVSCGSHIRACVEEDTSLQCITNYITALLGIPNIRANSLKWQPRYNVNHFTVLIALFSEFATLYGGKIYFGSTG